MMRQVVINRLERLKHYALGAFDSGEFRGAGYIYDELECILEILNKGEENNEQDEI